MPARGAGWRARWLLIDQSLSSLSNFLVAVAVARTVDPQQFGAFSLATVIFYILVELVRPLAFEALTIRWSGRARSEYHDPARGALSAGALLGILFAIPLAVFSVFAGPHVRAVLLALALILPGLFVQDAARFVFIAAGRGRDAAASDGLWLTAQLSAFVALVIVGEPTPALFLMAWGLSGWASAAFAAWRIGVLPRPRHALRWLGANADLGSRLGAEYLVDAGGFQLTLLLVGAAGGLEALGALNGARVLLGPLGVLFITAMSLTVTEGVRLRNRGDKRAPLVIRVVATLLIGTTLGWGLVLALLPPDVGAELLGDTFERARPAITGLTLFWTGRAVINMSRAGLRIYGAAGTSLRTMIVMAPLTVGGGALGGLTAGAVGASYGLAVAAGIAAIVWWARFEQTQKRYSRQGVRRRSPRGADETGV